MVHHINLIWSLEVLEDKILYYNGKDVLLCVVIIFAIYRNMCTNQKEIRCSRTYRNNISF